MTNIFLVFCIHSLYKWHHLLLVGKFWYSSITDTVASTVTLLSGDTVHVSVSNVNASLCVYSLMMQRQRQRDEAIAQHRMYHAAKKHIWDLNSSPVDCNITAADSGDFTLFGQLKHKFKLSCLHLHPPFLLSSLGKSFLTQEMHLHILYLIHHHCHALLFSTTTNSSHNIPDHDGSEARRNCHHTVFCCS